MSFTVYVLKSLKNGKQYVGSTSKNLKTRLDWHRWDMSAWTKQNGPFELLYSEERNSKEEALRREKYFKTGQGRRTLEILKKACSTPPQSVADSLQATRQN